jgi:CRISPR-associated protein Cmr2
MKMHTALTIGPIYKTFKQAKKTRELWAASYLFSYVMKNIISAIKTEDNNIEVIIPFFDDAFLNNKNEAGLFPDRFVFHSAKLNFDDIKGITKNALESVAGKMANHLSLHTKTLDVNEAKNYFKHYFQVYSVEKEFNDRTPEHEITRNMLGYLDGLELQQNFVNLEENNYIRSFLSKASFKAREHSFLISDSKEIANNQKVRFQSLIEISAKEIINNLNENDKKTFDNKIGLDDKISDESIVDLLKKDENFRTHHKYIAIVQIDGDNFGIINKNLKDDDFEAFSKNLANYSLDIQKVITGYGGLAVYIGGDDILCFAPVRNGDKNIFTLIDDIDAKFTAHFKSFIKRDDIKDDTGKILKPSLSVGVSITYYKYPLTEAMDISYKMLNDVAKKYAGGIKNTLTFKVIKHSGQSFETTFVKDSDVYNKFKDLVKINIDDNNFFSSVIQKFFNNFEILKLVGNDTDRIHHFRKNYYNEKIHEEKKAFFKKLEEYIYLLFSTNRTDIKNKLYSSLRMVKFLNRDDNE